MSRHIPRSAFNVWRNRRFSSLDEAPWRKVGLSPTEYMRIVHRIFEFFTLEFNVFANRQEEAILPHYGKPSVDHTQSSHTAKWLRCPGIILWWVTAQPIVANT